MVYCQRVSIPEIRELGKDPESRVGIVKFDNYDLDPSIYDEMFLSNGDPRPHAGLLYDALNLLSPNELASIQVG